MSEASDKVIDEFCAEQDWSPEPFAYALGHRLFAAGLAAGREGRFKSESFRSWWRDYVRKVELTAEQKATAEAAAGVAWEVAKGVGLGEAAKMAREEAERSSKFKFYDAQTSLLPGSYSPPSCRLAENTICFPSGVQLNEPP